MFVIDLIREMLTSPTLHRNAIAPEMDVISTINYINIFGKLEKCNYAAAMIWVCYRTRCSFPIKYFKYDSMVNKKK